MSGDLFGMARWSNAELAEVFGITAQRLGMLYKQGIIPLPENGLHDPKAAVAAYVRHLKKKDEGSSKTGEEVKKIQLENEMLSIRLQKIAGDLVPVDRVQKDWFESTRRVRDGLMNLPSRLSGVFAAESNQEKIFDSFTKEIHEVLSELSSRQFGQPVTESLPLDDAPVPVNEQTKEVNDVEEHPTQDGMAVNILEQFLNTPYRSIRESYPEMFDAPVVDERVEHDGEPDRFSTGD